MNLSTRVLLSLLSLCISACAGHAPAKQVAQTDAPVCRLESQTGSHMAQKQCTVASARNAQAEQTQNALWTQRSLRASSDMSSPSAAR